MLSLLRSDLYRLVRSWMPRAALACLFALAASQAWGMWYNATPDGLAALRAASDVADATAAVRTAVRIHYAAALTRTLSGVTYWGASEALSGGFVAVLVCAVAVGLCGQDLADGYAKTVFCARRSRRAYYLEKALLVSLISAVFVLAGFVLLAFAAPLASGYRFAAIEPTVELTVWLGLVWLLVSGYALVAVLILWLTRSNALAVVAGVLLLPLGILWSALGGAAHVVLGDAVFQGLAAWTPPAAQAMLAGGVPALFGAATGPAQMAQVLAASAPTLVRAAVPETVLLAVVLVASVTVCPRRDVA